jgi:single-strand DNA-binding protein
MNVVCLSGRLVADPELRYTTSGIAVCSFRIAVDRIVKKGEEKQADFISIVAWRHSAEFVANYMTKGRLVEVNGRLQIRQYVAQDGSKRTAAEVVANEVKGLDRPKDGTGGESGGRGERPSHETSPPDDYDPFWED